jgi:hypothetical protein
MDAVYLCLTCLKMSALAGDCHERPMIRCGDFGANAAQALEAPATHWLVQTVADFYSEQPEGEAG